LNLSYTLSHVQIDPVTLEVKILSQLKLVRSWDVNADGVLLDDIALGIRAIPQLDEAVNVERSFADFFLNLKTLLRLQQATTNQQTASQKWNTADRALNEQFLAGQKAVHAALLDNFNTPRAVEALQQITRAANVYMKENTVQVKSLILLSIAKYITKILTVFGVSSEDADSFGVPWEGFSANAVESELGELLDDFCARRDAIRAAARAKQSAEEIRALLHQNCKLVNFLLFYQ
jgi:cysteinyl-tRNA synthetase